MNYLLFASGKEMIRKSKIAKNQNEGNSPSEHEDTAPDGDLKDKEADSHDKKEHHKKKKERVEKHGSDKEKSPNKEVEEEDRKEAEIPFNVPETKVSKMTLIEANVKNGFELLG